MEKFKDIPGYEGKYQINKKGEVKSVLREVVKGRHMATHTIGGNTLKNVLYNNGYYGVMIKDNSGKTKLKTIHRLLAIVFIENPANKPCINHKDGNKQNNSLENLEWVTFSENNRHAHLTGLNKGRKKKVINNTTGEVHLSLRDAFLKIKQPDFKYQYFSEMVRGHKKNKTSFNYL